MQSYLGTIVFKFGGDPVICLREEAMYMYIMYIMYVVTNRLQYFAPASGRSNKQTRLSAIPHGEGNTSGVRISGQNVNN